jgi:urate oxidase
MPIVLGDNRYGKAEIRLVQVDRDGRDHALRDLTVAVSLAGDLAAAHLAGDNSAVLSTDTQKNTVYAFAAEHGIGQLEEFGLRLARHFVDTQPSIALARVALAEHGWARLGPHSFQRTGAQTRTAEVCYDGSAAWVVSGVRDLVLLNSTDSEFAGYVQDRYTTLPETKDRILATSVTARWRHAVVAGDRAAEFRAAEYWAAEYWAAEFDGARDALVAGFVETYSRSLQQTLYEMGRRVLEARPGLAEVRLSLPNRHHVLVDLTPFGMENPGRIFQATDRPYGLIEGTVLRDDAPPAGRAWG